MVSRLLTARSEVQVLGGREGSANRSVMSPWASPITAMSTMTVVPEDYGRQETEEEDINTDAAVGNGSCGLKQRVGALALSRCLFPAGSSL